MRLCFGRIRLPALWVVLPLAAAVAMAALACGGGAEPTAVPTTVPTVQSTPVLKTSTPNPNRQRRTATGERQTIFVDVTDSAGVRFKHHEVETEVQPIGAGVVVFDYDNDDLEDIYVTGLHRPQRPLPQQWRRHVHRRGRGRRRRRHRRPLQRRVRRRLRQRRRQGPVPHQLRHQQALQQRRGRHVYRRDGAGRGG